MLIVSQIYVLAVDFQILMHMLLNILLNIFILQYSNNTKHKLVLLKLMVYHQTYLHSLKSSHMLSHLKLRLKELIFLHVLHRLLQI